MQVRLIGLTVFSAEFSNVRDGVGFFSNDDASCAEQLIEFAGRNCYQSWHNPAGKTNAEYIRNILEHGHGSVLEHASATFFITGVSRSLSHELIRHRHLSFSELSQRFVNVGDAPFIVPPALEGERIEKKYPECYEDLVQYLEAKGLTRKQVREAARCCLPNGLETKLVVTGNFRAWRGVIESRGSEHADAEIRRLAVRIAQILAERFPAVFGDAEFFDLPNGEVGVRLAYHKV